MSTNVGRPAIDDTDTVAMTLRIPRKYHANLTRYAIETGIRSPNVFSAYKLICMCIEIEEAQREAAEAEAANARIVAAPVTITGSTDAGDVAAKVNAALRESMARRLHDGDAE